MKKNPHYNPVLIVAMIAIVAIIALLIVSKRGVTGEAMNSGTLGTPSMGGSLGAGPADKQKVCCMNNCATQSIYNWNSCMDGCLSTNQGCAGKT